MIVAALLSLYLLPLVIAHDTHPEIRYGIRSRTSLLYYTDEISPPRAGGKMMEAVGKRRYLNPLVRILSVEFNNYVVVSDT